MRNAFIFSLLAILFACQSRTQEQTTSQTQTAETVTTTDTLCYRQILSRDTTTLRLVRDGNQATGYLDSKPYEKDRARGPFQGRVNGSTIQADWQRLGEGTTQPYTLDLTMSGDSIAWYEGERVEKQGKWQLKTPDTGYRYVLNKVDCAATSMH